MPAAAATGITTIPLHQPGNYVLVQAATPMGYVPSAPVPFSVSANDVTKDVTVVNRLGGKAVIHVIDEHGAALAGACFHATQANVAYYSACDADDGANDGTTSIVGLAAGDYELTNYSLPPLYAWLPVQPFTVALGETKTFNLEAEPYGTIEIHKKTPGGDALPGACFEAQPTTFMGGFVFGACDGDNDGTISIRAPEGDFNLVETVTPRGYVAVEPPLVHVDAGQTVTTTIIDPTPSTAIIRAIDVSDAIVPGLCWRLTIPSRSRLWTTRATPTTALSTA